MNKRLELHSGDGVRALGARNTEFPLSARYGMAPGDWVGAVYLRARRERAQLRRFSLGRDAGGRRWAVRRTVCFRRGPRV